MENIADIHHLSTHHTKVRCRNCTRTTGAQRKTFQVCRQCNNAGLCSEPCFREYHQARGFTMIAAAIKKPDTMQDRSRDPALHFCVNKPPSSTTAKPRGKCTYCRIYVGRMKDTYKECNHCKKPFCNNDELNEHHRRLQMLDEPQEPQESSSSGQNETETQTESRSTQTGQTEVRTTQSADNQYSQQDLPATPFHEYYFNPRTYAHVPYMQWPLPPLPPSSTPLQTPLQTAYEYNFIEGNTSSITPINPDPIDDSLLLRTSPIGTGPKTPPELNQTEALDYSSQDKRPRPSESPLDDSNQPKRQRHSESPDEMDRPEVPLDESRDVLVGWLESQSNLKVTRSSQIKKASSDKAPAKNKKKKIFVKAKKNEKGEYADLFSEEEENTKDTKETKKKKKPAASTSSGDPGLGVTSIGPTMYPSSDDDDIDPVK